LATLGNGVSFIEDATLKELRRRFLTAKPRNPFRVANNFLGHFWTQGFQANPGLTLANAFSVYNAQYFAIAPPILAPFRVVIPKPLQIQRHNRCHTVAAGLIGRFLCLQGGSIGNYNEICSW
jgi:hypothetical protein